MKINLNKYRVRGLFLTALFCFTSERASAQDFRESVSISFGASEPLGAFSSVDADLLESGGALSGSTLDLELKSLITKNGKIGIVSMLKSQKNALSKDFLNSLTGGFYKTLSTSWKLNGYMVGAYYNLYQKRNKANFFVQPKLLFGLLSATSPEIDFYLGGDLALTKFAAVGRTFATMPGFDIGWDFGRFKIQAQYDFLLAKPTFNSEWFDWDSYASDIESFSQKMRTYSGKISIGYNFGKVKQ